MIKQEQPFSSWMIDIVRPGVEVTKGCKFRQRFVFLDHQISIIDNNLVNI